jgi:mannose-6-phosphate isomerase-like protein (cupin superfamily)
VARGYVVHAGHGVGGDASLKASRSSTRGSLTLIESVTDGGAPPHVHEREDEAMYVIDGQITVHCGDDTFVAGEGSFVFMPRGVLHDWDVDGDRASVLIIATPGGLEEFLDEFHAAADWPARDAVAARYGLRFPR